MEEIAPTKTLVEKAYGILVSAICSGELLPGQRLNQDELASKLNVSRQPINQAIVLLKNNGLALTTGKRSVIVAPIDLAYLEQISEFRIIVELFAAEKLMELHSLEFIEQEFSEILVQGDKALANDDIIALANYDMNFHTKIYMLSENVAAQSAMTANWHHIQRAMHTILLDKQRAIDSHKEHIKLVKALANKDTKTIRQMIQTHIKTGIEFMHNYLLKPS